MVYEVEGNILRQRGHLAPEPGCNGADQIGFGQLGRNSRLSTTPHQGDCIIAKKGQQIIFAVGPIDNIISTQPHVSAELLCVA
ncbi:MAG: hypothetical protein A2927_01525 [Candidatus Komeilibacteria bacterium RIFCSPLOWO2_01_FULL_45_10]|uniref:Uncharacterized protein n=1 Tax=Candidatus Komeilibacteria bacterium RIFCSPLOWO2_01_FULL_45_10 TaxID=1798550 RepID=A0A1G2BHW1_9BACT|nr:MAG: hypothetical protein A2927_01525 [Candidatus Komeilibacteria bacterium RIFCSPLOWO2_01_FULL_45_10]